LPSDDRPSIVPRSGNVGVETQGRLPIFARKNNLELNATFSLQCAKFLLFGFTIITEKKNGALKMTDLHISFPKKLYDDIVRFSDGGLDPATLAENLVIGWIEQSVESDGFETWGDRLEEVAELYAPHVAEQWRKEDVAAAEASRTRAKPLVWKLVEIPAGSKVRMQYNGTHHYAEVGSGAIIDDGQRFSPSEWARKVADDTSRNAWRDIWVKFPRTSEWVAATTLREKARSALSGGLDLDLTDLDT
jgi:hypothetical protein